MSCSATESQPAAEFGIAGSRTQHDCLADSTVGALWRYENRLSLSPIAIIDEVCRMIQLALPSYLNNYERTPLSLKSVNLLILNLVGLFSL